MEKIERAYKHHLAERQTHDMRRALLQIERPNARQIIYRGKTYLNFSSNDYLALGHNDAIKSAAADWALRYGAGSGASRLVTGNLHPFADIEKKLAAFKGKEACLLMASGFQANATILQALLDRTVLGEDPLVFTDRLNHASMHFGLKAAGVRQYRYRHCDTNHLHQLIDKAIADAPDSPRFIVTETVFSMDGDRAPLDDLYNIANDYDALLIADDAHGVGVLGPKGSGLGQNAHIVIGTCSKAFGSFGAYAATSTVIRDYLVNACSGLIYSTALPPSILGSIDAALDLIPRMDEERRILLEHADHFRKEAGLLGLDVGSSTTHIVPVITGDAATALHLSRFLLENGLWATAIRPPTVPKGSARVRIAFTAAHTSKDVETLLSTLNDWTELAHHQDQQAPCLNAQA